MTDLFRINDSLTNKISYYHLLLLLFSLPFDMFYSHLIIVSFSVHTLINVKKESFKTIVKTPVLILQAVFWVTLIAISYSPNKSEGFTELGRQTVILIIPILFCLSSFDLKKYRNNLLLGFALCCTLTVAYLYFDALHTIRFYKFPLRALFSPAFTNHNFSNPIGMHATFFSLQIGIALVYLVTALIKPNSKTDRAFYGMCCIILAAGMLQLSSKSACGAVLVAIGLVIPYFALRGKRRITFMIAGVVTTAIASLLLSKSSTFKERYFTDLRDDLSQASAHEVIDPRLARWDVALQLVRKSPVIGYGSGSEISLLKEAFFTHKFYSSYLNSLNAHNEYLSFMLKSGIIGLAVYLITLAFGFKIAYTSKDVMFITLMLLIAIVSISENMLDVDKGTIFYGLFFSFFLFSKQSPREIKKE